VLKLGSHLQRLGDKTRVASISILLTALWLASSGCTHRSNTATSSHQSLDPLRTETVCAFELERRADRVIDYERPDSNRLWTPGQTARITATDRALATAIASVTPPKRELAVVIIGKPVRHEFPEPRLRAKVESMELILIEQGFARAVFQLATATGRSIYPTLHPDRESLCGGNRPLLAQVPSHQRGTSMK
jgi:hypothetical protein